MIVGIKAIHCSILQFHLHFTEIRISHFYKYSMLLVRHKNKRNRDSGFVKYEERFGPSASKVTVHDFWSQHQS